MRKRITNLFLVLALCLTLLPTTALAEEAGAAQETQDSTEVGDGYTIEEDTAVQTGTGAAATGEVFQISSAEDLEAFSKRVKGGESSLNAVLVKDVSRNKNSSWTSIKGYTGVFDGNGHTITLYVGVRGEDGALFGSIASGGTVQDLTVQIYGWLGNSSSETGSIAYSNNGTIQRCHALSWLGDKNIGGIVYKNESTGLVKDCRVGKLTLRNSSENLVGGIAYINNGTIKNCYAYDELRRWTSKDNDTSIQLPSSTAIVRTNSGTVKNCYYWQYDSETAVAGTPVTDKAAFASGEVAYKLNGEKTELDSAWRQNLLGNKDGVAVDDLPVTDATHGRVYYDSKTASYYSLVPHLHGEEELTAWQQTDSLPDTSGSYYLTGDVTFASGQTLSNDVTLCVNGHSVTGDVTVTGSFTLTDCGSGSVTGNVTVNGGGSFTLEDCALSGKIENSGMLTVTDGTVTAAGGIGVDNKGTFTMNSGTITAASGTGVANNGTLTMNGGTVTGCDKGIEGSGDITVSGKVKISGNTNGNLILPDGKTVSVGTLDSTANIGITAEKQGELTAGGSIRLTSGGAAYTTRFFADNAAAYAIFADGEDLVMRMLGEHTHCICGHPADGAENIGDHTAHADVTFQPWTSGNSLPTTGNYYLTQNVVVDKTTVLTGTLCLNGYTISAKDGGCPVKVSSGELNLTDCAAELGSVIAAEDKAIVVYSTANIFNGVIRGGSGVGIYIGLYSAGARVAIYGGKITGSGTGAAVNSGEIHMYGGEISKNSRGVQAGAINRENHSSSGLFYLHGGKITDNHHGDRGGGVYVEHNFYMDGGEVSNNSATGNGGGIYMNSGSISLSGGKVTGNRAGGDGGGVCTKAYRTTESSVKLSGSAEISGNQAGGRGGGVYLDVYSDFGTGYLDPSNSCNLIMDGGSITGNTSVGDGGGVYAAAENKRDAKSYVNVKGSAQITGNKKGEEDNNLYLPNYSGGVTIGGDLDQTADIRVTTENKPGKNSTVTIAKKSWQVSSVTVPDGVFKVDGADGKISVDDKGNVTLAPCSHSWTTYTASGAVITAKCSICSASGGSVTINKPAHTTYGDGQSEKATLTENSWQGLAVNEDAITYTKGGTPLGAAPTNAGEYTASITLGDATASVVYTIAKAAPTASDFTFAAPSPLTYDGNAKTATVEPNTGINGMGAVTVKYFKNGAETEPKDAGDYTVKVSVAEGANYNATTDDLTTDGWKFTIGKATQTITVPTDKTIVKDGIAEDISDWATVAGVTGGSAPGTLSYTLDGSYTGVALKGNQLTVDSSVATGTTITIKVTAEETGNYNKDEQTFTVKVADKNTATVTITGLPDTVTYGQEFTLAASQTGDTTGANKKWTWDYDQEYFKLVAPNANTETITLQAIKTGTPSKGITATYESGTHKGSVTVNAVVEKKEVTVSGITAENKEYDGGTNATVNASGAIITGKETGDDLTVSVSAGSTFDSADAGSRTVTLGTLTLDGTSAGNYTLATSGNQTTATANITVRDLTVKPNSGQSKSYGTTPDPVLAYTSTGTVTGETAAFDGALSREAGEDVGQYDITKGSLALKDSGTFKATNYNLVLDTAVVTFEITKGTYGGSAPTKTVNILKNYAGVQTGTLTAADFFTTAPAEAKITNAVPNAASSNMMSIAGADSSGNFTYDSKTNITAASDESWTVTISSKNYTDITAMLTFSLVDRTNAGVTISGVPTSKTYGDADFNLTASATTPGTNGTWTWVSGDSTVLQVTGSSAAATVKVLKAGSATITAKYESDTTMGEQTTAPITVGKRVITVTADNKSMTVNGTLPTFTVTYGNLPSGVQAADIFGPLASASTTTDGKTIGSFDITVTTPVLKTEARANYEVGAVTKGTLTVNPRSSSGGGGGSSVSTYSVTVDKTENGSVSVSPKSASKGNTVTITVTPDKGYVLETLTVLDKNDKEIKLTEKNGKYTFTMPASKVTVKATFMDDNTMLNYFVDVKTGDYFYNAVLWAVQEGITSGTDATHFSPNASCTRAQIVTFLWRAAGSPEPKNMSNFKDVPADSYYAKAVAWAVENGITGGTGDGKFSPNATCTRAQAMTFLYRASGSPAVIGSATFSDVAANAYYADAVKWAEKNEITGGIGGGLFGADNDCTRAQIVTFLYRAYSK
jgi:hypothetical protein